MLFSINAGRNASLVVFAYDIGNSRRARLVRQTLESIHHAKQYSVFEVVLNPGEIHGLVAEIASHCEFQSDLLATWKPLEGIRLSWIEGRMLITARNGQSTAQPPWLPPNTGNFVVCYDISDDDGRQAVAREMASQGVMVQRSVYWLRESTGRFAALFESCGFYVGEGDRLWAYPLRRSGDLWHIGASVPSILPIAGHRWRQS